MAATPRRPNSHVMSNDPKRAAAVYYDGGCPVCSREIGFYKRRMASAEIDWRDVNRADAAPDLSREDALARFHIRQADGALISGARAFLALWRNDRRLGVLARALDRQPFLWALELGYAGFLKARSVWR